MLRPHEEPVVIRSVDMPLDENCYDVPSEIYNAQTPSGMPPHELKLKPGCIVILLRNLNVGQGLCNGSRLIVDEINPTVCLSPSIHCFFRSFDADCCHQKAAMARMSTSLASSSARPMSPIQLTASHASSSHSASPTPLQSTSLRARHSRRQASSLQK